jgi:signal transduction histidine kinase
MKASQASADRLALDAAMAVEQREHLNVVKGSADSLLRLRNDLLDFAKAVSRGRNG